jgi:hypothetical protein
MPYIIKPIDNKYKVCKRDEPSICFSKKGLSKEQADKQRIAIILNEKKQEGGQKPLDEPLYNKIKEDVYKEYPKHSLYRSALIVRRYKEQGGEYDTKTPPEDSGIRKWLKEKWIDIPSYIDDKVKQCGSVDTEKLYGVYPLCMPLIRAKKFSKDELKKLVKEKDELKQKHIKIKEQYGKGDGKDLYKLYPSTLKNRKWDLYYKEGDSIKKVSFGHPDYEDYTQHHDKVRRKNYLTRTANMRGEWKDDPWSRNNLSREILWGKSTDINKNLNDYLKKIGIK